MRIYAIVLNPENQKQDKFEILDPSFLPEEKSVVILKTGDSLIKASVSKIENVLERVGESADFICNIFIKIFPPEENVN